ncbi:hypothetical protein SDC9_141350 [bioreactor metagenome]|uniref:Uncharacterized protein n=1 Tax=bioreactor metagenome TaxID=1076179 RepID=A0A645DY17_9ZZZZ
MSLDGRGLLLELFDDDRGRVFHALAELHAVRAGGDVFDALADHRAGEDGGGRGPVAGDVVGLGGYFFDELRAHILERIFEFDLFSDGHAVVGDGRRAEFLLKDYVASLGAECDAYRIRDFIDPALHRAARVFSEKQCLCHDIIPPVYLSK